MHATNLSFPRNLPSCLHIHAILNTRSSTTLQSICYILYVECDQEAGSAGCKSLSCACSTSTPSSSWTPSAANPLFSNARKSYSTHAQERVSHANTYTSGIRVRTRELRCGSSSQLSDGQRATGHCLLRRVLFYHLLRPEGCQCFICSIRHPNRS